MKSDTINKIIVGITSLILTLLWFYSLSIDNHYKWDFFFLMFLLLGLFILREKIKLHPLHFFLASVFLLLHDIGMFGTYSNFYLGIEYDLYVHSFFGFVASLILYRTYNHVGPYKGWFVYVAIIAILLGFSAFHELFEYAGALTVGEGEGVLFVGAGDLDPWDTQKDMFNNLWGGILGLSLYKMYGVFYKKKEVKQRKINKK